MIRISPGQYLPPDAPIPPGPEAPAYADVALFHEMVHAVRSMWGLRSFRNLDPDPAFGWGFRNSEEFYAVLVENMYRSERRIPLRGSYLGPSRMRWRRNPAGRADPYARLEHTWVRRWLAEMPNFVHALEQIPLVVAHYNPFANARYGRYRFVPTTRRGPYVEGDFADAMEQVFPGSG